MNPKKIIEPIQMWLLRQGKCVGCGRDLGSGESEKKDGVFLVTCTCRRVFVYHPREAYYRRAFLTDLK